MCPAAVVSPVVRLPAVLLHVCMYLPVRSTLEMLVATASGCLFQKKRPVGGTGFSVQVLLYCSFLPAFGPVLYFHLCSLSSIFCCLCATVPSCTPSPLSHSHSPLPSLIFYLSSVDKTCLSSVGTAGHANHVSYASIAVGTQNKHQSSISKL